MGGRPDGVAVAAAAADPPDGGEEEGGCRGGSSPPQGCQFLLCCLQLPPGFVQVGLRGIGPPAAARTPSARPAAGLSAADVAPAGVFYTIKVCSEACGKIAISLLFLLIYGQTRTDFVQRPAAARY